MEHLEELYVAQNQQFIDRSPNMVSIEKLTNLSEAEKKIRAELENEIEKDLEEELKDSICRLALNLHSLYLHRKEKSKKTSFTGNISSQMLVDNEKATTVIKITTTMAEGSKIKMYEEKTENNNYVIKLSGLPNSLIGPVDWPRTLRADKGATHRANIKKNKISDQCSALGSPGPNGELLKKRCSSWSDTASQCSKGSLRNKTNIPDFKWKY